MINRFNLLLSLAFSIVCATTFGDGREDANVGPVSLERAILDFNEASDQDRERLGLLRLTEQEVVAAIRGSTRMPTEDYALFTQIAETKKLPANAKLLLFRRHFANGYKSAVWNIVLSIKKNDTDTVRIEVRNHYLSTEKDTSILKPLPIP